MCTVETGILSQSNTKPLEWKQYKDDVFSLWDTDREEIDKFIEHANRHHATIKFTAETFLDTCVYKAREDSFMEQAGILVENLEFDP